MRAGPGVENRDWRSRWLLSLLFLWCSLLMGLQGCSTPQVDLFPPVTMQPFLYDDGEPQTLQVALAQQRKYLLQQEKTEMVTFAGNSVTNGDLLNSLEAFQGLVAENLSPIAFNERFHREYTLLQAGGRGSAKRGEMLVTGYYEPVLEGSLVKEAPYIYPLYSLPADLVEYSDGEGGVRIGRRTAAGSLLPYWTRQEIDEDRVLAGNELVYLKDRFDAFLLHIQGSGKIRLPDGSLRSIRYRGNNGHPYRSIGKLLVEEKKMSLQQVDVPALRSYLDSHPEEVDRILYYNRRYIFFAWGEGAHPRGSLGLELTPGRSIAIDGGHLPTGLIGYLVSRSPVFNDSGEISHWQVLHRFVLPQDSGAAIKGAGRVDLFMGSSEYARLAAGAMKENGKLYFLIHNDSK